MKTVLIALVTFFILKDDLVSAQVASSVNYTFTHVTNGSLTDMSTGASNLLLPKTTNGNYKSAVFPIGFDFWLMGTRYNYFSVNSNGLLRLGRKALSNTASNDMTNGSNLPLLCAFWDDLNSFTTSSTSKIRYKVTGTVPNRMLTIEWKDFIIKKNSSNGSQLSKWQIRLYETTGVFEYVYGRMQIASSSGTVNASIGMTYANATNGLIAVTSITTPAIATTAVSNYNTLVGTNVAGNITGLNSAADGSRVKYTFTSWLPNGAPSNLTFTAVGSSSMTLNWNDNATNELGYVIYRSDDGGATYRFAKQTAANTTSSVLSALLPNTTYYWKVYALTEGALSASVNGSQATVSCASGPTTNSFTFNTSSGGIYNWSVNNNWSLNHPPTSCENAVISYSGNSNRTVNMDIDAAVNSLTINATFNSGTIKKKVVVNTSGNLLTLLTDLSMSSNQAGTIASGTNTNEVNLLGASGSVIRVNGNCYVGQTGNSQISYIGADTTTELNPVPVPSQDPEYYFNGNITFIKNATRRSPGSYHFNGGASQTITNNSISTNPIRFTDMQIGDLSPTTLTITASVAGNHFTYADMGSVDVVSGSTLVLGYKSTLNQYNVFVSEDATDLTVFNLSANATLKLGDNFNGQPGSNFPLNFDVVNIDSTSTIEYNFSNGGNQVIYTDTTFDYGNLILTGSTKSLTSNINILGDLTVNSSATFYSSDLPVATGYATTFKGNNFINNGAVVGTPVDSRFTFNGSAAQSYSGTGSFGNSPAPFDGWGIDIANTNGVTLNAPVYTNRLNLFYGTFINSNQFTIGNGITGKVYRGGVTGYNAGSLDAYATLNVGNKYIVHYDDANAVVTGFEIPPSTNVDSVYIDNSNGVTMSSDMNVTTNLQLEQSTLDMLSNKLSIGNTISKASGILIGSAGTLEMNGTVAQAIPSNLFQNNSLKNLIISNTNSSGVTLGGALDIYHSLTFGPSGLKFTTGGFLAFKSTATETAWLGDMTGKTIVGDAIVERYIPNHTKAWQFLSVPTSGQTIKESWQEGSSAPNNDPNPGFGTQITSSVLNATTHPTPGFDVYTASPSMKTYDSTSNSWMAVTNTAAQIANAMGYMIFVRGDRSVTTSAAPATATVLRTKGTLYTPANPPAVTNLASNTFQSIGNPYASAVDLTQLYSSGITGGVQDIYYVWDPKLTSGPSSAYGFGGYQTFTRNGSTYDVTPGGGSYPAGICKTIESGQAFFVHAPFAAGSVSFSEACKISGSNDVNRIPVTRPRQLRTNLYVMTGNQPVLIDGNLSQYHDSWSNAVDIQDAIKLGNTGENLGIFRNGYNLAVERRKTIQRTDTIFYRLGQLRIQRYEFEFIPTDLEQPGLKAFLEDNYLHTSTVVSLREITRITFNIVNIPGSYAPDRFRLVFRTPAPPPVIITNVEISRNSDRSTIDTKDGISVYPNPVINKTVQLQFQGMVPGNYLVTLIHSNGLQQSLSSIELSKGKSNASVELPQNLAAGVYVLQLTGPGNKQIPITITVL